MFTVQRIYRYLPANGQTAVFIDRLYPRGVTKKKFASVLWLKDITPSAALRRWYHENPEQNFDGFVTRYHEELQGEVQQRAVARLLELEKQNGRVWLLTAVKNPQRSHVSALAQFLGAAFEYRE